MKKDNKKKITKTTVKEYGFTDKLIEKLLPEPMLAPNPHCRKAPRMKLWYEDDVFNAMESNEFIAYQEKRSKRQEAAEKAVETRRKNENEKIDNIINNLVVNDRLSDEELKSQAMDAHAKRILCNMERKLAYLNRKLESNRIDYWEDRQEIENEAEELACEIECFNYETPNDALLQRIIVNYIRHNLIDYDSSLYALYNKMEKKEKYTRIKTEVLKKIAEAYPNYKDECYRQIRETEDEIDMSDYD